MTFQVTYTAPNAYGHQVTATETVRAADEQTARVIFFRRKPARVRIVQMVEA